MTVRSIARTDDFVHACPLPNNRTIEDCLLQPSLSIFNFLCSLRVESMCEMLIIGVHPQPEFPRVAERCGVPCWSHGGRVTDGTNSYGIDRSRGEIRPAGRELPAERVWDSQLPGSSLGVYPDGLKDFSRNEVLKWMKLCLAELGIFDAIGNTVCPSGYVCVLGKGGSKLRQAQGGATGRIWGIKNPL